MPASWIRVQGWGSSVGKGKCEKEKNAISVSRFLSMNSIQSLVILIQAMRSTGRGYEAIVRTTQGGRGADREGATASDGGVDSTCCEERKHVRARATRFVRWAARRRRRAARRPPAPATVPLSFNPIQPGCDYQHRPLSLPLKVSMYYPVPGAIYLVVQAALSAKMCKETYHA